jgi:hypothetical protein
MIDLAVVGLLTAGVKLANEVVSLYSNTTRILQEADAPGPAADPPRGNLVEHHLVEHRQVVERQQILRETTVLTERVLDKDFVERIVKRAESNLTQLVDYLGSTILNELNRNRVRDAVQDVRAHAASLRILLNATELDATLVMQLITSALNPLQVSLAKARYVMEDYGNEEGWGWDYCYLVGSAALLAGYHYLGQRPEYLEAQLTEHSRDVHSTILDEIATAKLAAGQRIPWRDIPALLEPSGADALQALFEEAVGTDRSSVPKVPFDVGSRSVAELRNEMYEISDARVIDEMLLAEQNGRNRIGALDILQKRKQSLL